MHPGSTSCLTEHGGIAKQPSTMMSGPEKVRVFSERKNFARASNKYNSSLQTLSVGADQEKLWVATGLHGKNT